MFLNKAQQKKQPFFAVVWLGSPHEPYSGLEKDLARAAVFYELAANTGLAAAQYNLGVMYTQGAGVDASDELARSWFEKAAAQGNELAIQNLELMKKDGQGDGE